MPSSVFPNDNASASTAAGRSFACDKDEFADERNARAVIQSFPLALGFDKLANLFLALLPDSQA
jgi:hypothetical protein